MAKKMGRCLPSKAGRKPSREQVAVLGGSLPRHMSTNGSRYHATNVRATAFNLKISSVASDNSKQHKQIERDICKQIERDRQREKDRARTRTTERPDLKLDCAEQNICKVTHA